jgi:hypothetical protein
MNLVKAKHVQSLLKIRKQWILFLDYVTKAPYTENVTKYKVYLNYMPHDDGRMTETCCGNNIRRGEEEFLR